MFIFPHINRLSAVGVLLLEIVSWRYYMCQQLCHLGQRFVCKVDTYSSTSSVN